MLGKVGGGGSRIDVLFCLSQEKVVLLLMDLFRHLPGFVFICVCVLSLLYLLGFSPNSPVDLTAQSAVLGQDSATASPP